MSKWGKYRSEVDTLPLGAIEMYKKQRNEFTGVLQTCLDVAAEYGEPGNYLAGANIVGFVRVVNAKLDQGLV